MTRATLIAIFVGGVLFAAALTGLLFFSLQPATLRIAVGPAGGNDVKLIQAIAQAFTGERHFVRLRPVVTDGAAESAAALREAKVDLAVIRADLDVPKDAQSVAIFRKNLAVLWVPNRLGSKAPRRDSSIKKIEDLAGHRVGIVGKNPANVDLLKSILAESGVSPEKVEILQFGADEIGETLRNQKIDAFMAVGPIDSRITLDALATTTRAGSSPVFLSIGAAEMVALKYPVYESSEISAGALGANPLRPDHDVTSLGVNHLIVARKTVSEATVMAFTKQLFAVRHSLQNDLPGVTKIETPDTNKAAAIPAHPGAAAYIDGTERTFLDRYSDLMWLGLMVLSGLASGGAWLRSYLRRHAAQHEISSRLLDMIAAARESETVEELDEMQKEADEILRDTLNRFENGTVADETLSAFNIALDQFHHAVADRKTWIANNPSSQHRPSANGDRLLAPKLGGESRQELAVPEVQIARVNQIGTAPHEPATPPTNSSARKDARKDWEYG
jgi:TRAP transporter TAXI family solute receptor